jgi:hypothetical protein
MKEQQNIIIYNTADNNECDITFYTFKMVSLKSIWYLSFGK